MGNILKSTFLLTLLMVLLVGMGYMIGGPRVAYMFLIFSLVFNFLSYWFSDKIVLGMYRAKEVGPEDAPVLYRSVERMAGAAGLPMPRVYIMPSAQPNAFATGRNPKHAAVAVTEGLLRIMNERELDGVIGHELAHIGHRDILTGTIVASVVGAISSLAWMARWGAILGGFGRDRDGGSTIALLAMAIVAPIVAVVLQLAISRSREYDADRRSAQYNGSPEPMIRALEKLQMAHERLQHIAVPQSASPATAHMFIMNPFRGRGGLASLFSTHPRVEDRIARLRAIA